MTKQIAGFEFVNGAFGVNHGHLTRTEGGYRVNFGNGGDSFFFRSAHRAKEAFRQAIATARRSEGFRAYKGVA